MFGNHIAHCHYCHKQKITTDCINLGCSMANKEECPGYKEYLQNKKIMEALIDSCSSEVEMVKKFILNNIGPYSIFQVIREAMKIGIEEEVFDQAFRYLRDEGKVRLTDDHIIHVL